MSRHEQKETRKKQILIVALDLFINKGLAGTKVSDIAKAAGMSVGLLFHYFESKEALYMELVNRGCEVSKNQVNNYSENPIKFFEDTAKNILSEIQNNCFIAKMFVFMAQASNNDLLSEEMRDHLKWDNITSTEKIIRAGQVNGTIRDGEPMALAVAFWSAIQGICQTVLIDDKMPYPDYRWVVDIVKKN